MATAEELLSGVATVDKTLVISNDLRTISIPSSVPNLGVESDDDVLRLNFKMPRYIGDIDLSTFAKRINYLNAKGEGDIYEVKDAFVTSDYITFTWLVGPTATRYKGETKFNVCLKTFTQDGYVDKEFNTTPASLKVLEGLEVDAAFIEEYADILEQWRRDLFGIADSEEAKIRAVGAEVLATIPADYQTAVSMSENNARTKADAIICSTQGETISVSDSSDDYLRGLKIFGKTTQVATTGKNLFDMDSSLNEVITKSGDIYTARYDTQGYRFGLVVDTFIPAGQTVHFSVDILETNSVSGIPLQLNVACEDGTSFSMNADKTMTLAANVVSLQPYMHHDDINCYVKFKSPQLEYGSATTSYEPYSGGVASPSPDYPQELTSIGPVTVEINTKNLLPNMASTTTHNGVTYTVNVDGSITAAGTASSDADSLLYVVTQYEPIRLPKGTYIASGINGGSSGTYKMLVYKAGWTLIDTIYDGEKEFTLEEPTDIFVYFWVKRGTGINTTFYPMIRLASITETTYEPGKPVQSLSVSAPHTLPGIPVSANGTYTDSNGQQWICDEVDFERGVYVQRVATVVCDGTEAWRYHEQSGLVYANIMNDHEAPINGSLPGLSNQYMRTAATKYANISNGEFSVGMWDFSANHAYCLVKDEVYGTSVETWCEHLATKAETGDPLKVAYALATPVETPLTAEEIATFKALHTNYPNTTVLNDADATMELKYNADTKKYIENLPGASDEGVAKAVENYLQENDNIATTDYVSDAISAAITGAIGGSY